MRVIQPQDAVLNGKVIQEIQSVAEREGKYLAELMNRLAKTGGGKAGSSTDKDLGEQFVYKHIGSMASVGRYKALVDLRQSKVRYSSLLSRL